VAPLHDGASLELHRFGTPSVGARGVDFEITGAARMSPK
jgi:hypothetical protein